MNCITVDYVSGIFKDANKPTSIRKNPLKPDLKNTYSNIAQQERSHLKGSNRTILSLSHEGVIKEQTKKLHTNNKR